MITPEYKESRTEKMKRGGRYRDSDHTWQSCCLTIDKQLVMFIVQTIIGIGLMCFCAYQLATVPDCEKNSPYWGLIGTLCGFFFRKMGSATSGGTKQQTVLSTKEAI